MNDEEIYKKIEEIYNSEKGKGFIIHLLRSFFPVHKSTYLWDVPKNDEIKCCITGERLQTREMCMKIIMSDEMKNAVIDSLKNLTFEYPKKLKDKFYPIAITCEGSDKYLSTQAFKQLLNFYQTQLVMGDKKIEWVADNERAKEFVKKGKNENIIQTKKEERAVHRVVEHSKMKLGDLKALKDLKKRMDDEENERKRNSGKK